MAVTALADLVTQLASLDLGGWRGLPADLAPVTDDLPAALALGDGVVPADMVHLDDPRPGSGARAWLRDGRVVLVEVSLRPAAGVEELGGLGEPDGRDVVRLGTVAADEWVYADRGAAVIVDRGGDAVRCVLGFAPTTVGEYRWTLRPSLGTQRRAPEGNGDR